jgi:hypothetical protein
MAKGTVYDCERAIMRDPRSGLRVIRLTHSPCIATNLYFEMCSFSEDDRYVVILAQRYAGRDTSWDLMRARTDGTELVQITDADDLHGIVVSPETDSILYMTAGEVRRIGIHSLEEVTVARAPGGLPVSPRSLAAIEGSGQVYLANCTARSGSALLFKADLASGKITVLHESERQNHITVDASGGVVAFNDWQEGRFVAHFINADGHNLCLQPFTQFAHNTWFGATRALQGTLLPPGHGIVTLEEGADAPTVLASGRYYWHSSSSRNAEWIVSDTNWPQEGLYLLHVPSGVVTYVCDPLSSCSHPQWTHPHPALSPGMGFVLFNSDLTGIGQVYLVELTAEFLKQAVSGYECRPSYMSRP